MMKLIVTPKSKFQKKELFLGLNFTVDVNANNEVVVEVGTHFVSGQKKKKKAIKRTIKFKKKEREVDII